VLCFWQEVPNNEEKGEKVMFFKILKKLFGRRHKKFVAGNLDNIEIAPACCHNPIDGTVAIE